jgi:hypothetical protein
MKKAGAKPKNENDEGDYIDDPDPAHHVQVRGGAANQSTKFPPELYDRLARMPVELRVDAVADWKRKHGIMEGSVKDLLYTDSHKMTREEFVAHYVKEYQWDAERLGKLYDEFNKMDEGMTKEAMWRDAERMTREQFCDKWGDEHGEFWDNIMGDIDEGSMSAAEKHHTGPEFTGYWKGTDARTPGQHMVGSAEESIEEQIAREWQQYIQEAGANNPVQGAQDPVQQKAMAQKTQQAGQTFQKLQNVAGIKTGVGPSQAAKTAVANTQNPNINTATGQGMDQTGKKIVGALGKGVEDALVNAQPADANKLVQTIQQIKQKSAGTT